MKACNQLEIATHIEMTTTMLKRNAVAIMKAALTGTDMSQFTDVIEAAFVDDTKLLQQVEDPLPKEDDDDDDQILNNEDEHPKQPQASTSTLSTALKCKILPTEEPPSKKTGVYSLNDAEPYYPSINDKEKYLHC